MRFGQRRCNSVRKLSGFNKPSQVNEAAFNAAVDEITRISSQLLQSLETNTLPKNRDEETAKAKARSAQRFAANALSCRIYKLDPMFQPEYKTHFDQNGYVVVSGLFSPTEAELLQKLLHDHARGGRCTGRPVQISKARRFGVRPIATLPAHVANASLGRCEFEVVDRLAH